MKDLRRKIASFGAIILVIVPLIITVYLLYWSPHDSSARQTGKQRVFVATYMTMNNPYFQMLDAQIQVLLELNGDVLLPLPCAYRSSGCRPGCYQGLISNPITNPHRLLGGDFSVSIANDVYFC